jgi:hypothetical protein
MLFAFCVANYFIIQNSNEGIKVARDNANIELKAYISIKVITIEQFEVGKSVIIHFIIINVGKTPAFNIRTAH